MRRILLERCMKLVGKQLGLISRVQTPHKETLPVGLKVADDLTLDVGKPDRRDFLRTSSRVGLIPIIPRTGRRAGGTDARWRSPQAGGNTLCYKNWIEADGCKTLGGA